MTMPAQEAARSFDACAPEYDRYRSGYPDTLFDGIAERLTLPARPDTADIEVPSIVDCWTAERNEA